MKKTSKNTLKKTITACIPVDLLQQILDDPENISLCHALVSAIITSERIRKPVGAAADLDDSALHPAKSHEADAMTEDARRRAELAKKRCEERKQRQAERMKTLARFLRDEGPVALSDLFGTGLFSREQKRTIDAILNPTVRTINKLSPAQLRAYFLPQIAKYSNIPLSALSAATRRHAVTRFH